MLPVNNEWITFFDHHAPNYLQEVFTRNTLQEVEFILEELELPAGSHILDVGCGVGRHAVELARHGFRVTGIDISGGMLDEGRRRAAQEGVEVEWVQADASNFHLPEQADAAICLCEGAFGLLGSGDDPYNHELAILSCIHAAIKPQALFILTALNGMAKIRTASEEKVAQGLFDPMVLMEMFSMEYETAEGKQSIALRERGFVPSELRLMLQVAGFTVEHLYGGTAGAWHREQVRLDEMEIMAICRSQICAQ